MPSSEPFRYELLDRALERGLAPDGVLRLGSLYGAWARERSAGRGGVEAQGQRLGELVARMSSGPVAESVQAANEQHYELPAAFLGLILGPRRKYSGCLWEDGVDSLAQAEEAMLALSCSRAGIEDGMRVLDLGCGWGSLSLWLAERYPRCTVLGVSNSASQREWILDEAARRGLSNLTVETCDVNSFEPSGGGFDRVMSIEMFEHMRNWRELLRRVSTWLSPGGRAFVHVFSHRTLPYLFTGTWASARFFTAGLMPSHDLMLRFQDDMVVREQWAVPGTHYARTLQAWLARLDGSHEEAVEVLRGSGRWSEREARRLVATWRLFLISTDVIWGYRGGNRWLVSHYLLEPRT
jgi:cyclopropane-fatty-acyl-phospholipid synthase